MSEVASEPVDVKDLKPILRLRLPVIAVIAEKKMKMHEVLDLRVGSIVQLDKSAEDLLDLMVNDQRIGRGETVRIGENFGLQIAELGTVQETIRKLGGQEEAEESEESQQAGAEESVESQQAGTEESEESEEPSDSPAEKSAESSDTGDASSQS